MKAIEAEHLFNTIYPNKVVLKLPEDAATEMIVETEPTSEHPEYSVAVAAIYRSALHHHEVTTETYQMRLGQLRLNVEGSEIVLNPGDTYVVKPGLKHYAVGDFAIAKVISNPGWTPEDHILDENLNPDMVEGYILEEQWDEKLIKQHEDMIDYMEHLSNSISLE
jgi:quercetin dioxygenase-like cupin family protein